MTTTAVVLLVVAGLAATVDWWSVATDKLGVEFLAKPAVIICLIGVALAIEIEPGGASNVQRGIIIAALGASLAGDVVLMTPDARFEAGLASFLIAHLFYIAALASDFTVGPALAAGLLIVALGFGVVPQLLAGARPHGRAIVVAVAAYVLVVSAMGVVAAGTAVAVTGVGGMLFVVSDALLGWGRFVGPAPGGRVLVHVTYHLGQAGLVLWLAA
ncbi:MAG: lysoplasmalogenase family protein [Acidimicrobiales bacterium]|nr:lysoplasmalogenase family protein [Acidimicrobiales bacterium]